MSVNTLQQLLDEDAFPDCFTPVTLIQAGSGSQTLSPRCLLPPKCTLLLDGECALYRLYGGCNSDWVCGGQWKNVKRFVKALVERLSTAQIELVVFFNGSIENERLDEWIKQQKEEYEKITKGLRVIDNKGYPPPKAWWIPPVGLRVTLRLLFRCSGVKVVSTIYDHRKELMDYLRKNNCAGIIADDPEYIAFNPPLLISAQHFILKYSGALESKEYNLNKLREKLRLTPEKMCILMALLGNHIMSREELDEVLRDDFFNENSSENAVETVAKYINDTGIPTKPESAAYQLLTYADRMQLETFATSIKYYLESFNKSLSRPPASVSGSSSFLMQMPTNFKQFQEDTKDILIHDAEVKRIMYDRHRKGLMSPLVYQIIVKKEIKLPVLLEDFKEIPDIHALYKPVRQKIYAVLRNLHHQIFVSKRETPNASLPVVVIKEWTWSETEDTYVEEDVIAEPLGWNVPILKNLWFGKGDDEVNRRVRAFLTCMHADGQLILNTDYVPKRIVVGAIVLRYVMSTDTPVLSKPELDAFLVTFLNPKLDDTDYTDDVKIPTITSRGVQLAALFMVGVEMVTLANDACGSPIPWICCAPWLFFDGRLFQHVYYRSMEVNNVKELCEGDSGLVMAVEQVREAVLEGINNPAFARRVFPKPPRGEPTSATGNYPPAGMRPEQGDIRIGRGRSVSGYERAGPEDRTNLDIPEVGFGSCETSRHSYGRGRGSASYLRSSQAWQLGPRGEGRSKTISEPDDHFLRQQGPRTRGRGLIIGEPFESGFERDVKYRMRKLGG